MFHQLNNDIKLDLPQFSRVVTIDLVMLVYVYDIIKTALRPLVVHKGGGCTWLLLPINGKNKNTVQCLDIFILTLSFKVPTHNCIKIILTVKK